MSNCYLRIKGKDDKVIETFFNVSGLEGGVPYVNIQVEGRNLFIYLFFFEVSLLYITIIIYVLVF